MLLLTAYYDQEYPLRAEWVKLVQYASYSLYTFDILVRGIAGVARDENSSINRR